MSTLKTKWGKRMAVVMAIALTVASIPGADAQAAKKAKLSTKKLTVKVGKKKTIKIKNKKVKKAKYTFKVKKASIAKVSKKGVVTGKKAGSTTVTVKEKKGKKTRKLGTVKVTVKKTTSKKTTTPTLAPSATAAPTTAATATPTAPAQGGASDPTKAPDPTTPADPTEVPGTPGPTKTPKPTPTVKPQPTADTYKPQGKGWMKLDLSTWSGGSDNYLETGGQIVLSEVELETVPIPQTLDAMGDKIEVLIRGSVPAESDGFRYWVANDNGGTLTTMGHYSNYGEGVEDPRNADDPKADLDTTAFKAGQFQVQRVLEHINKDNVADDKLTGTKLLLKGPTYGTTLDGIIITGIWVRYGENIGNADVETPGIESPGVESPGVESPGADTSATESPKPTDKPIQKVDTDVELTKANSTEVGALYAPDYTANGPAVENEDGSITYYTTDVYSGGGLDFNLNKDKSHFDITKYKKIQVTVSCKQKDRQLYLGLVTDAEKEQWGSIQPILIDAKPDPYPGMKGDDEKETFDIDLTQVVIPQDTDKKEDCGVVGLRIKYNGWKGEDDKRTDDEKKEVHADITVHSIKFVK